jgi:uncharacterized protein YjlB
MPLVSADIEPLAIAFGDDGLIPNNPLPFLVYRGAVALDPAHPEKSIETLFGGNGWGDMWRNGIYDYVHYHATVHEALGVARGHAHVRFGGEHGKDLRIAAGDVAILPAGTGHQCLSASADLSVVGAYPPGVKMQIMRPTPDNHASALKTIPLVELPERDPVMGADGPLQRLWRRRG